MSKIKRKEKYIETFSSSPMSRKFNAVRALATMKKIDPVYIHIKTSEEMITEVLDEIFPNKWDLVLRLNKDITKSEKRPFLLDVVIHYPYLEITNTEGQIHSVKDMYISLKPFAPVVKGKRTFGFIGFKGRRMTASYKDVRNNYQHSHLPSRDYRVFPDSIDSNDSPHKFRGFCLGESEIKQIITILAHRPEKNIFKMFLLQLGEYLNWESIEGTPYIRIGNFTGENENGVNVSACNRYYKELIMHRTLNPFKIDFKLENNIPRIVENERFEQFIKLDDLSNEFKSYRSGDGKFHSGIGYTPNPIREREGGSAPFLFRGEKVEFKMVPDLGSGTENRKVYLNRKIKDYVKKQFEKRLEDKANRDYISKQYNTFIDTRESPRTDKVFMPDN